MSEMFKKEEVIEGGSVGVTEPPERHMAMDEATINQRAKDMAPGTPWTPLEDAKDEDFKPLFDAVNALQETGDMPGLVDKYQYGIREMKAILADFKNSPVNERKDRYEDLEKVKKYMDEFDDGLGKNKDLKYQNEFFAKVDYLLKKEGIDRGSLIVEVQETMQSYNNDLGEKDKARPRESVAREMVRPKQVEQTGFFKGLFR